MILLHSRHPACGAEQHNPQHNLFACESLRDVWSCLSKVPPATVGTQGDVLSGTLAAFKSWVANNPEPAEEAAQKLGLQPAMLAAWGACATVRQVHITIAVHTQSLSATGHLHKLVMTDTGAGLCHCCYYLLLSPRSLPVCDQLAAETVEHVAWQAAKVAFEEKRRGELAEDVIRHLSDAIAELYES